MSSYAVHHEIELGVLAKRVKEGAKQRASFGKGEKVMASLHHVWPSSGYCCQVLSFICQPVGEL